MKLRNLMIAALGLSLMASATKLPAEKQWLTLEGKGRDKSIVLIAGDEEYRSEEALPQLGKILAAHHGFKCTVVFPIDPKTGIIDPNVNNNIPGLEALKEADLMIIATRFRNLPDKQMKHVDDYLKSGRPVIGMRTATHAFNIPRGKEYSHYGNNYGGDKKEWKGGFGRLVLGEKWISHHGGHKSESTRGIIAEGAMDHPIARGISDGDIWGPTDVYGVRLPLPGDSKPIVLGQVMKRKGPRTNDPLFGMRPTDDEPATGKKNDPMMPVAWTKSYLIPGGKKGKAFTTTMGASTDLLFEGTRKMLVNAVYWLLDMSDAIPESGTNVDIVGEFEPTAYSFHRGNYWSDKALRVEDFE